MKWKVASKSLIYISIQTLCCSFELCSGVSCLLSFFVRCLNLLHRVEKGTHLCIYSKFPQFMLHVKTKIKT